MNATRPKRESEEKVPGTCTIQDVPFVNYLPKEWDKAWLVCVGVGGFNMFYLLVSNIVFFFAYKFLKKTQ
uniref:PDR_CDR domain-containing protein n=1 Tax=Meloidogyne hapla TaxID=6305 RepID=A0A1I8B8V4_MELHA